MAKGKQIDNETVYKIMLSYYVTNNFRETGRQLGIPHTTVKKVYDDNKEKPEFLQLCTQKKEEFVETANRIINKGTTLLERRLDTALNNQDELEEIIYEIWNADKQDYNETQKKSLVQKVSKLQLNSLSEITTSIGIIYDKKKIAETGIVNPETPNININIIDNEHLEKIMYEDNQDKQIPQ